MWDVDAGWLSFLKLVQCITGFRLGASQGRRTVGKDNVERDEASTEECRSFRDYGNRKKVRGGDRDGFDTEEKGLVVVEIEQGGAS